MVSQTSNLSIWTYKHEDVEFKGTLSYIASLKIAKALQKKSKISKNFLVN